MLLSYTRCSKAHHGGWQCIYMISGVWTVKGVLGTHSCGRIMTGSREGREWYGHVDWTILGSELLYI